MEGIVFVILIVVLAAALVRYLHGEERPTKIATKPNATGSLHGLRSVNRAQDAIRNRPRVATVLVRDTLSSAKQNESTSAVIEFMESEGYELLNIETAFGGNQSLTFRRRS